jgi:hypothetical protein
MDVQISQTCLQVSLTTAAYYFWAEHINIALFGKIARGLAKFKMCKNITCPILSIIQNALVHLILSSKGAFWLED